MSYPQWSEMINETYRDTHIHGISHVIYTRQSRDEVFFRSEVHNIRGLRACGCGFSKEQSEADAISNALA